MKKTNDIQNLTTKYESLKVENESLIQDKISLSENVIVLQKKQKQKQIISSEATTHHAAAANKKLVKILRKRIKDDQKYYCSQVDELWNHNHKQAKQLNESKIKINTLIDDAINKELISKQQQEVINRFLLRLEEKKSN